VLDDWQRFCLDLALSERADGTWAANEMGLVASRQNGKNAIVEARELFGVTVLHETVIHTSHVFRTTRESFERLMNLIEAHPDIRRCLVHHYASVGAGYSMRFRGGGRINFIARSRQSGRGLTGDLLILDEAQDLTDEALGALLPTISARPGAQAWYLGSAPDVNSTVFHRLRRRGRAGTETRLAYLEHSAEPDADLDDRDAWAQANPALGIRISETAIASERAIMADEQFARERLSITPDLEARVGVFPGTSWADVCSPNYAADQSTALFGVDINPERSAGAIVAVSPGPVVELVDYRPGVSWLPERCVELARRYRTRFALDRFGPAGNLADQLAREHIELVELDARTLQRACALFFDLVAAHTIKVRANPDLDRAVEGAAKRQSGDTWTWQRKNSRYDISPLVAGTAGVWALTNAKPTPSLLFAFA
jgi:hypothetical protein